jgi:hypothetical protein
MTQKAAIKNVTPTDSHKSRAPMKIIWPSSSLHHVRIRARNDKRIEPVGFELLPDPGNRRGTAEGAGGHRAQEAGGKAQRRGRRKNGRKKKEKLSKICRGKFPSFDCISLGCFGDVVLKMVILVWV